MHQAYLIPNWFFGFDIGMEVLFAIITLCVSAISFRIYSMTQERKIKLFGIAFLLIGISYIIWAGINCWFTTLIGDEIRELSMESIATIGMVGLYSYIILFTSGLVNLVSTTCNSYKGRSYYLIFGLSLLVIVASINKLVTFRIVSAFLLFFVAYHYLEEYLNNKNRKTFYVMLAFLLLFLSNVDFIFLYYSYKIYVIGHLLELAAYLLILTSLVKSVKK